MALIDFLRTVDADVATVLGDDFEIEVTRTWYVPTFDDPAITYDNLTDKIKKCKLLESCVLYVDIRNSASISASSEAARLARMYSAFVKNMIAAARHFGGHVRNIIGDRVMVVFDKKDCFTSAHNTAALMHTISKHIINKKIKGIDFKCGIGIDYGEMLIVKGGAIRHGAETEFYRTLVWLGRPANVASRLTDLANKEIYWHEDVVWEGFMHPTTRETFWLNHTKPLEFIKKLENTYTSTLKHKDDTFFYCLPYRDLLFVSHGPILVTEDFYEGFKKEHPTHKAFAEGHYKEAQVDIKEYTGKIYGADIYYADVEKL